MVPQFNIYTCTLYNWQDFSHFQCTFLLIYQKKKHSEITLSINIFCYFHVTLQKSLNKPKTVWGIISCTVQIKMGIIGVQ